MSSREIRGWSQTLKNCLDQSLHVFASPHDHPSHLSLPVLLEVLMKPLCSLQFYCPKFYIHTRVLMMTLLTCAFILKFPDNAHSPIP